MTRGLGWERKKERPDPCVCLRQLRCSRDNCCIPYTAQRILSHAKVREIACARANRSCIDKAGCLRRIPSVSGSMSPPTRRFYVRMGHHRCRGTLHGPAQKTGIPEDTLYSRRALAVKADPAAEHASAAVRRDAGHERAGCRGTEPLLPRAETLPAAGRGLADGLHADQHPDVGSDRAGRPTRGSTAHRRPDARAGLQGEGVGGGSPPTGAPKKVRALFTDPADNTSTWSNDAP